MIEYRYYDILNRFTQRVLDFIENGGKRSETVQSFILARSILYRLQQKRPGGHTRPFCYC